MTRPRLSRRRLAAMEAALCAMLAGEEGQGDWPPEVTTSDAEAALDWVFSRQKKGSRK